MTKTFLDNQKGKIKKDLTKFLKNALIVNVGKIEQYKKEVLTS